MNARGYAVRWVHVGLKKKLVTMHRIIAATPLGYQTDHIDGNKLDNRKSNLRFATTQENQRNRGSLSGHKRVSTSIYKGVSQCKKTLGWRVRITNSTSKSIYLGKFPPDQEKEAALKYDSVVEKYHGKYGRKNFG